MTLAALMLVGSVLSAAPDEPAPLVQFASGGTTTWVKDYKVALETVRQPTSFTVSERGVVSYVASTSRDWGMDKCGSTYPVDGQPGASALKGEFALTPSAFAELKSTLEGTDIDGLLKSRLSGCKETKCPSKPEHFTVRKGTQTWLLYEPQYLPSSKLLEVLQAIEQQVMERVRRHEGRGAKALEAHWAWKRAWDGK